MTGKPERDKQNPDNTKLNPGDEAAPGTVGTGEDVCPTCEGAGRVAGAACKTCGGTGRIVEGIGGA